MAEPNFGTPYTQVIVFPNTCLQDYLSPYIPFASSIHHIPSYLPLPLSGAIFQVPYWMYKKPRRRTYILRPYNFLEIFGISGISTFFTESRQFPDVLKCCYASVSHTILIFTGEYLPDHMHCSCQIGIQYSLHVVSTGLPYPSILEQRDHIQSGHTCPFSSFSRELDCDACGRCRLRAVEQWSVIAIFDIVW